MSFVMPSGDYPMNDKYINFLVVEEQVEAMYAFQAEEENELTFKPGDIITVIEKIDDGWWFGHFDGKKGLFPSNYVKASSVSFPKQNC